MHILTALQSLFFLVQPLTIPTEDIEPISFRVQVYPYGGYYSYPPYCPPGYTYGPGFSYGRRGFSLYYGPGYPGCYYYGGDYFGRRYYGPYYRHHRGHYHHHGRHHHRRR